MKSYAREFEIYLKDIKKSSSNTLESYLRDVNQFASYCDENKIEIDELKRRAPGTLHAEVPQGCLIEDG